MILDLLVRVADDRPEIPYAVQRKRIQGGEIAEFWADNITPGWGEYGIVPMTSDRWRLVRVLDALAGDVEDWIAEEPLRPEDLVDPQRPSDEPGNRKIQPRRRRKRWGMQRLPGPVKNALRTRKLPDVDLMPQAIRDVYLAKVPGIDTLPNGQRRTTVWDHAVTRQQVLDFLDTKDAEGRDGQGQPVQEAAPLPNQGFLVDER